MARSSPAAIEEAVNKATDENLTTENWADILEVCDIVNDTPDDGPRAAVAALTKRLSHRSANVQIYALTLANALAQNCGTKMHRELASRAFTQCLIRVATDRTVHTSVKSHVVQVMEEMTEAFKGDPSLSIMADSLAQVTSSNPRLHAPDKPERPPLQRIQTTEDDELQMVLALSLKEQEQEEQRAQQRRQAEVEAKERQTLVADGSTNGGKAPAASDPLTNTTRVRALYDLTSTEPGELSFRRGDIIFVLESVYQDWWKGSLRGEVGIFPLNYVTPIPNPTPEDLKQEAEEEAKVFAETANIERLLALLSAPNASMSVDSTELESLYRSAMAVRPSLFKLIDRYAIRKEEMLDLNERFTAATKKYDDFLNTYIGQYKSPRLGGASSYAQMAPSAPLIPTASIPPIMPLSGQSAFQAPSPNVFSPPPSQTPYPQSSIQSPFAPPRQSQPSYPQLSSIQTTFSNSPTPAAESAYSHQPAFSPTASKTPYSPPAANEAYSPVLNSYHSVPSQSKPSSAPFAPANGQYGGDASNQTYPSTNPYTAYSLPPQVVEAESAPGARPPSSNGFTGYPDLSFTSRR